MYKLPTSDFSRSAQKILQALPRSRQRAVTVDRLMDALEISEAARTPFEDYLAEFAKAGLAEARGGRYWRKPSSSSLLIGSFRCTRTGHSFVVPEDTHEQAQGDLYIPEKLRSGAMHGDQVVARMVKRSARGRDGAIESVLRHANRTVVGRFIKFDKQNVVSPIEERILNNISIAPGETFGALPGQYVNVEITRMPAAGRPPKGKVIEVLGDDETPGIDIEVIIRKHHLAHVFPSRVLAEAARADEAIPEGEVAIRLDMREQLTITIDGETARDFDDAVSLEMTGRGRYLLSVHIADVSHFVTENSALDDEAFLRATSVYFPERAIPMLPERLSNVICSLNPNVDRLTMSALMELDGSGRVVDYRIAPTIIRSRERMTYTAVSEILTSPDSGTARQYGHISEMLFRMRELASILIEHRREKGAIDFDLPEAELVFDHEGEIHGIVRSERNIAHRIIEQFMLAANETVANHLQKLDVPALYRIHDEPAPTRVEEFRELAESFGHRFSTHGPVPQRGFQRLLKQVEGLPEEKMLSYLMLRSMERARYSAQNRGHYGLAMSCYTHFTSPIRRYPDLIVHRILREVLTHGRHADPDPDAEAEAAGGEQLDLGQKHSLKRISWPVLDEERETELRLQMESIADHSSQRERGADAAEQELMSWRKAEFMHQHVGDEFDGIISSVKDFGFYVELNDLFVEGLVHISTLHDDLYEFDRRRHRLTGTRRRKQYRLGDPIRVQVDRVDRVRHLIDFSVV